MALPLLGRYMDGIYAVTGGASGGNIYETMLNIGDVHFTVIAVVVFASTFVPKGSWALNPSMLYDEKYNRDLTDDEGLPTVADGGSEKLSTASDQKTAVAPGSVRGVAT